MNFTLRANGTGIVHASFTKLNSYPIKNQSALKQQIDELENWKLSFPSSILQDQISCLRSENFEFFVLGFKDILPFGSNKIASCIFHES